MSVNSSHQANLANEYDPLSPSAKPNVEDYFTELRATCPIHHHTFSEDQIADIEDNPFVAGRVEEMYSFFKYADVESCLMQPDVFLNHEGAGPERMTPPPGGGTVLYADGEAHRRSRMIVAQSFAPRVIGALEPMIQSRIDDLIDAMAGKGAAELMTDFALPLTSGMVAYFLGLPAEMIPQIQKWGLAIMGSFGGDDIALQRVGEAVKEIGELVYDLAPKRAAAAQRGEDLNDSITALVTASDDHGSMFNLDEVVNATTQIIGGGFETSATAIVNGVYLLWTHPEERRKLEQQPELMGTAIDETLRYMSPIEGLFRTPATDVEFAGVALKKGTKVRSVLASANHDEDVFSDPDVFKIDRDRSELRRHVAFGKGKHTCPGSSLARLQLKCVFSTLLRRIPTLELDPQHPPKRNEAMIIHGYDRLPVRWDPGSVQPR